MEKRIELERRNRPVSQIDELNLDHSRSTTIEGLTDEFQNLKSLSLNGVGLTSLKGFPALLNLRKLEMGDNRIAGGLQVLKECVRLVWLNLSNNKIKDLETIEPLKDLPALKSLDLYRNDITRLDNYRAQVFELLPGLTFLDGTDVNNKEADESDVDCLEEDGSEGVPVNGKSDLDGDDSSVKNDHYSESSPEEEDPSGLALGHDEEVIGANEGDSNYESSISVVSPEEPDDEDDVAVVGEVVNYQLEDDDEDDEELGEGSVVVYEHEEGDDDDEDEDEDDEEDEGETSNVNTSMALAEIYREDLSDCSDGGDYEEESEEEDDFDEDGDEDLETSNVIEDGEAEVPGEMDLAPLEPHEEDDENILVVEGDIVRRGVKRPREDASEGD